MCVYMCFTSYVLLLCLLTFFFPLFSNPTTSYLRTLLVMCWISTLPDHGFELLRHCTSHNQTTTHKSSSSSSSSSPVNNKHTGHHHHHHHHHHRRQTPALQPQSSSDLMSQSVSSFESRWMEYDEAELNKQLPKHIEAHWSSDYGEQILHTHIYYYYYYYYYYCCCCY
jgi:hypothetical protein